MSEFDVEALDSELKAAGLPILGCSSNGDVQFSRVATSAEMELAENVKAAHHAAPRRIRFTAEEALAIRLAGEADLSAEEQAAVDAAISTQARAALRRVRTTEVQ